MSAPIINNIPLRIEDKGQGIPIVWAHGLMDSVESDDLVDWYDWKDIAAVSRIIRYDARGHGKSGFSRDVTDYLWPNLADDMLGVAQYKQLNSFVAAGRSMGAATAVFTALKAPESVSALILINPPTGWHTRDAQSAMFEKLARLVQTPNASLLPLMLKKQPENKYPEWLVQAYPRKINSYIDLIWSADPERLKLVFEGAALCDLPSPDSLSQIQVPTLILAWDKDSSHPMDTALQLHQSIKSSTLFVATDVDAFKKWPGVIKEFISSLQ